MKKKILLFIVGGGLGLFALSSYREGPAHYSGYDCTGAEAAASGSFSNPTGCTTGGCHAASAASAISVTLELDSAGVPTTHYKGGLTYTVKISGTNTGASLPGYGFQLNATKGTASASTNVDAGTWATTGLPASTQVTAPAGSTYFAITTVEHSSTISISGSTFTQSFTWTAPVTGTGSISFWGVANFVNNNGRADAGDLWNTAHAVIGEWSTTEVATVANEADINIYPNPVVNEMNVQLNHATGSYTVSVYDLSGRMISNSSFVASGTQNLVVPTSNWVPGMYIAVVSNGTTQKSFRIVKN